MDRLVSDLRYGVRLLRKSPVFTVVAIGTLALGIGANTAIFSIVDATIIRALPYADPDRLVMVWEDATLAGFPRNTPAPGNYTDWRRMNRSFTGMAATRGASASLTTDGAPEQVMGRGVTPNFFTLLGVQPLLGRTFTEDEDRTGAPVTLVSYALWQRRYGGDPSVVGRTILMNDNRYEIIGVMPRQFVFRNREVDYWVPMHLSPAAAVDRSSHYLNVVGRLKPGVALDVARAEMHSLARELERQFPGNNTKLGAVVVPIKEDLLGNTQIELLVLMGAAAAILLIACANLASLLLTRIAGRRGELAIRAALGASPSRLVRQMVVEATVLSMAGGAIGLALTPVAGSLIAHLTPVGVPSAAALRVDRRILGFAFALSIATGLVFSIMPAVQAVRSSLQDALQQGARGAVGARNRLTRDALVIVQVGAALALLVATGLMLRTLVNLRAIDIGFRADHLLTMRTTLPRPRYTDPVKRLAFYDRVIAGVRALPGIERAAYGSPVPFTSAGYTRSFWIDGQPHTPGHSYDALNRVATNDYLQTLGVRLAEGRLIDDRDVAGAPLVIVINETMAREFWGSRSAIGHNVELGDLEDPPRTVVGVVHDVHERGYELAMKPGVYVPLAQMPDASPETLVMRVTRRPADVTEAARRVIAGIDPTQPVTAVRTMDDIIDSGVADRHQQTIMLGAFAALALLLASLGLYGLLAYGVTERRREIGLRIALGATRHSVIGMVVARGLGLTTIGLAVGVAAAWGATRAMTNLLYGVGAMDPLTVAAVVALLGTVALAACALPALRASRVDPMIVLRDE
jgi:putative ABC transport system permease protein